MVEGETERTLVPRVLDLLGVPRWPSRIQLVDMGGIDAKLDLLAAYAATPQLGESLESRILLTRPLTRFLVAVDPEKAYATGQQREQVRTRLVDKMLTHLSVQDRTPMIRQQLEELVSVETWGTKSFEFAHFSNDEIARAILQVYQGADAPALEDLTTQVGSHCRTNANLKTLWQDWSGREPSKVAIAEALWPVLEAKIRAAQETGMVESIPVARVVLHAGNLAQEFLRSDIMLRR